MHNNVTRYIRSLDALITSTESITDDEVKSHMAKYICIKVSGLLEVYFKTQIGDYVDASSSKQTAAYVKHKFKTFTNIDADKIDKVLSKFSDEWANEFSNTVPSDVKSSISSIVSNRNNIAHGNTATMTLNDVSKHYANVKKAIQALDHIIKK